MIASFKCRISEFAGNKVLPVLILFVSVMILLQASPVHAKTFTNKDIEALRTQYERKNPQPRHQNPPGVPTVPPPSGASGVPVVPGAVSPGTQRISSDGAMIIKKHLPFAGWEEEYREYFQQYYRDSELSLKPGMIVLQFSGTENFSRLWHTFVNGGTYDGKKGHLSVHYIIDKDGSIYELMPPNRRVRGTYGVNHVAITVSLIGRNEQEIIDNNRQMRTSFALVRWLMNQHRIPKEKVLAHTEVAVGKELVPEYTDFYDTKYPNHYPPNSQTRGPGRAYMFKLRYFLVESN
jgi:N-acetylmuramoyl-L-alanine amidase